MVKQSAKRMALKTQKINIVFCFLTLCAARYARGLLAPDTRHLKPLV
jgi:hypothetical protein